MARARRRRKEHARPEKSSHLNGDLYVPDTFEEEFAHENTEAVSEAETARYISLQDKRSILCEKFGEIYATEGLELSKRQRCFLDNLKTRKPRLGQFDLRKPINSVGKCPLERLRADDLGFLSKRDAENFESSIANGVTTIDKFELLVHPALAPVYITCADDQQTKYISRALRLSGTNVAITGTVVKKGWADFAVISVFSQSDCEDCTCVRVSGCDGYLEELGKGTDSSPETTDLFGVEIPSQSIVVFSRDIFYKFQDLESTQRIFNDE